MANSSASAEAALVECNPNAPLPTVGQFRRQSIPPIPTSGDPWRDLDLCDGRWQWYQLSPEMVRPVPRVQRSRGADGVTRTRTVTSTVDTVASVAIVFDTVWTRQANRFPTSDVRAFTPSDQNLPLERPAPSRRAT